MNIRKIAAFVASAVTSGIVAVQAYASPIADLGGEVVSDLQSVLTWELVLVLALFPFIAACWLAANRQFAAAIGMMIITAVVLWGGQQVVGA